MWGLKSLLISIPKTSRYISEIVYYSAVKKSSLSEAMAGNGSLIPLDVVACKDDSALREITPNVLQSKRVEYQGYLGLLGRKNNSDLSIRSWSFLG